MVASLLSEWIVFTIHLAGPHTYLSRPTTWHQGRSAIDTGAKRSTNDCSKSRLATTQLECSGVTTALVILKRDHLSSVQLYGVTTVTMLLYNDNVTTVT